MSSQCCYQISSDSMIIDDNVINNLNLFPSIYIYFFLYIHIQCPLFWLLLSCMQHWCANSSIYYILLSSFFELYVPNCLVLWKLYVGCFCFFLSIYLFYLFSLLYIIHTYYIPYIYYISILILFRYVHVWHTFLIKHYSWCEWFICLRSGCTCFRCIPHVTGNNFWQSEGHHREGKALGTFEMVLVGHWHRVRLMLCSVWFSNSCWSVQRWVDGRFAQDFEVFYI